MAFPETITSVNDTINRKRTEVEIVNTSSAVLS